MAASPRLDPTETPDGTETVDARSQWLAPGIIDLGVFATDKPAFHFGGITRAALMPDAGPLDEPGLVERAAKGGKPDLWVHPLAAATKGLAGTRTRRNRPDETGGRARHRHRSQPHRRQRRDAPRPRLRRLARPRHDHPRRG